MKEKFSVSGMTCSACSAGIERTLNKKAGVVKAEVYLMSESMTVEYDEEQISQGEIIAAVCALGYDASVYDERATKAKTDKTASLKRRFFLSLVFLVPLIYFSMGGMIGLPTPPEKINAILQAILSLVVIVVNFKFFVGGTRALLHKVPNMDTLVSLGSAVSYLYSVYLTVRILCGNTYHAHLFYESAAMILTLVTLGKWLEEKSAKKTGEEVEKLLRMMPDTVTVERNGTERTILFSDILKNDILIVKQGEYIPVDGIVSEGHAFVDRAAVTGESMPVEVTVGSSVTGADIVKSGFIKVKAERVGKDTTLSQIVRMVKEAGASKAPIQKIADKIAGVFVPFVVFVSVLTFLIWFLATNSVGTAANYAISVLVISCPCALGLATPVAVMAATGRGMSLGILFKNAEALQKAEKINTVLLDKTATLTVGAPKVTDFKAFEGELSALTVAAAVEKKSNHPIAECVYRYALERIEREEEASEYSYETGKGARAKMDGKTYVLGNLKILSYAVKKQAKQWEEKYAAAGKTAVFLATEQTLAAVFAVADTLKETSKAAVAEMKKRGLRVAMITGDNERVAKSVAKEAGLDDYFAEALPEDKVGAVERLQRVGGVVAMVGDGINDSPALKAADLGIAMGNGTDVAIDSADVVLAHGNLESVTDAVDLSKATVRNIKQNLFWAFFYNCVAIPVAAGAFAFAGITLNPMIAAACMSLSSLFVVGNALRLTRFKKEKTKKTTQQQGKTTMKKNLTIEGMMCNHCVMHVKKALETVVGEGAVEVSLADKTATVQTSEFVSDESLKNAVVEAGYEVIEIK